jgi:cytochrome bd ubiquinol oxidase subunit II
VITAWYAVVSFMLIIYIVLDGRNFGAGMLHWFVAKTTEERRQVVAAIGPLWPWHEVWLVGFGGTLVAVFPKLMASAFSGYYLALFLILWCLLLRGMALEVGGHIKDAMWQGFWDFVFVVSSFLLAILFGAAGGNMARGVPLDAHQNFSMAFFTNFGVRGNVGLLDWYTVSVALFAMVLLAAHGANYLTLKTEGPVHDRSAALAKTLWLTIPFLLAVISAETWIVRPDLPVRGFVNPFSWLGVIVIVGSGIGLVSGIKRGNEERAFLASNFLIIGLLATGAATIFPVVLFSTLDPANSLTAASVAAPANSLFIAAIWWPFGAILAFLYFIFIARRYTGKVSLERDTQGYG